MNAVLRHVGQAMHEANDLVPPPMHPWHFRQLPENDCRGDTPFETAKLPKEGNLDIWTDEDSQNGKRQEPGRSRQELTGSCQIVTKWVASPEAELTPGRPVVTVHSILYTVYTDRYDTPDFRKGLCLNGISEIRKVYIGSCTPMAANGLEAGLMISMNWTLQLWLRQPRMRRQPEAWRLLLSLISMLVVRRISGRLSFQGVLL